MSHLYRRSITPKHTNETNVQIFLPWSLWPLSSPAMSKSQEWHCEPLPSFKSAILQESLYLPWRSLVLKTFETYKSYLSVLSFTVFMSHMQRKPYNAVDPEKKELESVRTTVTKDDAEMWKFALRETRMTSRSVIWNNDVDTEKTSVYCSGINSMHA